MKKLLLVYLVAFIVLCASFFFVERAYSQWSEYSLSSQRANEVLIGYEDLGMQISNAAVINPELMAAKNSGLYLSIFSADKTTILAKLDKLKALVRDSINIRLVGQLNKNLRPEIDWIISSNVPDSIINHKARKHIVILERINELVQEGLERTRFLIVYRQERLGNSFNRLLAIILVFLFVTTSLLIYAILGLFMQGVKIRTKEGQLREKDLQYRYILDHMLEGAQIHDFNWRYTYVNETLATYSKCKKEDLIGFTLMEKYPGIEQSEFFKTLETCMKERTSRQMETKFIFPDGSWADFEVSIQPVPEGLFILSIDRTEQQKAKHKLEKNIKYLSDLKLALDESSIVAVTDQKGIISHVNDKFCKISKYSAAELIGQDHRLINSGFHDKSFIRDLWTTIAKGKIWKGELKNLAKDGTYYWVDTTIVPFLDKNGKPYQYYAIRSDITERKNNEEKIRINELKYKTVVDTIHECLIIEDLEGKLVYANSEFIKTFGFSLEELSNLTLKDYTSDESYPRILERHNKRLQGLPVEDEFIYKAKCKDGKEIWIEARVSLVIEDGKIIGTQSVERDISERVAAEEKIRKTSRMLAFLSAINQSIVHSNHETELLDTVCNIATGAGQFKLAYIGLLDEELMLNITNLGGDQAAAEKILRVRGFEVNNPTYKDVPTVKVLKTGQYSYLNDMQNDPALTHWKEDFKQHGIHASISLPIFKFGKPVGVLGLHAGSKDFFDTEEIALLVEAAGDISFALDNFEKTRIHKETEDQLLKNEKRFRGMIEKSADFKTLTDKNGRLIYGSPSVLNFFGYSPEEFLGKEAMSFFHPDDASDLIRKRNEILKKPGAFYKFQYRVGHKNGSWVWCEGTVTNFLQEPAIQAMVTNFRDISKMKMAEEQKEFDNNNLDALINNTNDLMWSIDKNFRFITFNRRFLEVIKMATGKELGKGDAVFSVALSDEQERRFRVFYKRALDGEVFTETDVVKEPYEYAAEISFYPIHKGNEIIGTACYSRDVSERLKQEKERENMIKQLTLNNNDLRQFAYITSHNLRGPVANLLGLTGLLDTLKIKDPKLTHILSGIKTATGMFDETLRDLATVLTLRDNPAIQLESLAFADIFEKVKDFYETSLSDCEAKVLVDFSGAPRVNFNKAYLESIFMNLLTNAIKYKDEERTLVIRTRSYQENDCVMLQFSDNGIGFDADTQKEKVFKLYQRFHIHKEGKGLGLFLIKSQLDALGGTIDVKSAIGSGTTFTIKFNTSNKL